MSSKSWLHWSWWLALLLLCATLALFWVPYLQEQRDFLHSLPIPVPAITVLVGMPPEACQTPPGTTIETPPVIQMETPSTKTHLQPIPDADADDPSVLKRRRR